MSMWIKETTMKYYVTFSLTQTFNYPVEASSPDEAIDFIYALPPSEIDELMEGSPDFIFQSIEDETGQDYPIDNFDCDY